MGILKQATALATALAAFGAAVAAEEAPRFESMDVLESLGLFANQQAGLDSENAKSDSDFKVDFSFRGGGGAAPEPGFLYLQDANGRPDPAAGASPPPAVSFTPRLSALEGLETSFSPNGRTRSLSSFTPRYAGAGLSLSVDPDGDAVTDNSLGLDISSELMIESPNTALHPMSTSLGGYATGLGRFDRRSVNIGVSLGYAGFRMGASMSRETGGFETGYAGVDIGLAYMSQAFSTELSVGEYDVVNSDLALVGLDQDFTRLELGAAYAVSERVRFSGGVRLFDYSSRFGLENGGPDRSGVLYLGTRLNF